MNIFAISGILTAVSCLLLAILVFRRGKKKGLNQICALFNLSAVIWGIGAYLIAMTTDKELAFLYWRIAHIGIIFIPVLFVHFIYKLLKINRKNVLLIIYGIGILFLIADTTPWFISNMRWVFKQFYYDSPPGILYSLFLVFFAGLVIYGHYELVKSFKRAQGIKRQQIKYLLIGTIIGFSGGSTSYLPVFGIDIYPVLNSVIIFYPLITTYAILRYQFMDIKIVMRRGSIFLLTAGFVYGFFYLVVWLFNSLFGGLYTRGAMLLGILVAGVFVGLFFLFEKAITRIANKYFFGGLYLKHEALRQLTKKLTAIIDLESLAEVIVKVIKENLGLDKIAILLKEPKTQAFALYKTIGFREENGLSLVKDNSLTQYLQRTGKPLTYEELDFRQLGALKENMERIHASLCLPLNSQQTLIGIIVLGKKVSGEAYSKEDIELLEDLSNQASVAIENARLYEQVKDLSENLQEKVDEQTKELQESYQKVEKAFEIEKQAHQELKRVDEAKTQFIMATQHHLRTPLTALKGYLSMAMEGDFGEVNRILKEKLGFCFISANRLIKLVNEFLDMSKFQLGRNVFDLKETLLSPLLQEAFEEVKPEAEQKGIYFKLEKPAEITDKIMADSPKLKEAFYNLIDNAVKYTEKGGVTVKLKVDPEGEQAPYRARNEKLKIIIQDTGIGMTPEETRNVFGLQFERGEVAKKVYTLGRGIGLYIAANIIKAHQGRIWAESQGRGKGSSFYVELPMKQ